MRQLRALVLSLNSRSFFKQEVIIMQALVFVLKNVNDIASEAVDDVTVLNELPYADYTEEVPL